MSTELTSTNKDGRETGLSVTAGSVSLRIKDLPPNESLTGVRFRYPKDGKLYFWVSQWQAGVWGKKKMSDSQVFPLFCDDLMEALEWEVSPNIRRSDTP